MPKRVPSRKYDEIGMMLGKAGENAVIDLFTTYSQTEVPGGNLDDPGSKPDAYEVARNLAVSSYWLKGFLQKKVSVFNFGLKFKAHDAKKRNRKSSNRDAQKLREWLDSQVPIIQSSMSDDDAKRVGVASGAEVKFEEKVRKFCHDTWMEFLLLDCAIGYWNKDMKAAVTLPPERCRYRDVLGIETLFYRHGLTEQEIKLLPPADQERFKEPEIMLDPKTGDYFRVLKLERVGQGLPWPSIQSVFRTMRTLESMEMGESAYAFSARMKFRHHKVGHSIETGPNAGKPFHFWTKKWGDSVRGIFENKRGFLGDYIGRHDHTIDYPHEDTKYFDEEKWKSPEHRLIQWGGPLAEILANKGRFADLREILMAEAMMAREQMKMFLESVINQAFEPPVGIKIEWGNTIFYSAREFVNLLNFGLRSGPLSQSTWRQNAGFDDQEEDLKKEAEAEEAKAMAEKFRPAFDADHGEDTSGGDGKPPGGKDGDNMNQD